MALPMNDDFANCELSVEELEAIAGGWPHWLKSAVNGIEHGASSVWHAITSPSGSAVLGIAGLITGIFGSPKDWFKSDPPPLQGV